MGETEPNPIPSAKRRKSEQNVKPVVDLFLDGEKNYQVEKRRIARRTLRYANVKREKKSPLKRKL